MFIKPKLTRLKDEEVAGARAGDVDQPLLLAPQARFAAAPPQALKLV